MTVMMMTNSIRVTAPRGRPQDGRTMGNEPRALAGAARLDRKQTKDNARPAPAATAREGVSRSEPARAPAKDRRAQTIVKGRLRNYEEVPMRKQARFWDFLITWSAPGGSRLDRLRRCNPAWASQ